MWAVLPFDKYIRGIEELVAEANRDGSERIIAVVGGALLEEAVERTLRERLIDDSKTTKIANRLTKPENALGNTTTQIDLLYLLGALDDKTCKAMKGLAGIRNYFAHHTNPSFDSQDENFVQSIKRLTLHDGRTCYPHALWGPDTTIPLEPVNTRRDQFIVNPKLALVFLMRDRVSHATHSNVPRSEEEMLREWPNRFTEPNA
jgi:DNA-binding MltR family transcriptional regulator